jgi:hypothetical protein
MIRPSLLLVIVPLVLATFLAATASAQNYTAPPPPSTSWTPVADVNDPTIQQVGQFAVRIYALSTRQVRMSFLNVVSCQTLPNSGGYNYSMVITVTGGKTRLYDASVWGILGTMSWKLWSFTPLY